MQRPLVEAEELAVLKREILDQMRFLKPHPFWTEKESYLISRSMLQKGDSAFIEYSLEERKRKSLFVWDELPPFFVNWT